MNARRLSRRLLIIAIITAAIASFSVAQNVSKSELQFRQALHKQQVEGDLSTAIKLYQDIAMSKTADRAVKAKALLQLAACYEKLGRQSDSVYQQIVRDFADQPAAAQARAKIATLRSSVPASTMTLRKIEMGQGVQNVVATDGQRAVYWDSSNTTLFIGDTAGKNKREIYRTNRRPFTYVSRDLTMVFFYFPAFQQEPPLYAIVKSDGTGLRDFVLIENGERVLPSQPVCLSWSWDSRYLLMCKGRRPDRLVHLLKISVADGMAQDLTRTLAANVGRAQFSRDQHFIAYGGTFPGPVRVIPSEGGDPHIVSQDGVLSDWSRDGGHLSVAEFRDGAIGLAIIPMRDGKRSGEVAFVSSSLPVGVPPITMLNGTMVVMSGGFPRVDVSMNTLDGQDRLGAWKPLQLVDAGDRRWIIWSSDGGQIAYGTAAGVIRLRSLSSGEDRELYRSNLPQILMTCLWARQHPSLYCGQIVDDTMTEIVSVPLASGPVEKLGSIEGRRIIRRLSPDDRKVYSTTTLSFAGYEWEIGTDHETRADVAQTESYDGDWVATVTTDSDNRRRISLRPRLGDADSWQHLAYIRIQGTQFNQITMSFTRDGNWIVYHDRDADGRDGLYRVSTSGGESQRLGDYPANDPASSFVVSPDGRHFIAQIPKPPKQIEFWILDNFIPTPKPGGK